MMPKNSNALKDKTKAYLKTFPVLVGLSHFFRQKCGLGHFVTLLKKKVSGFAVPTTPCFDSEASTNWFKERLKHAKCYLEYGSGGSTYLAAKLGVCFVSIETDKYYLRDVKNKIKQDHLYNPDSQQYIHANIGSTREWGHPFALFGLTKKKLVSFEKASSFPSDRFQNGATPDLILIDGRFRVACALKAIRSLKERDDWTLVVDDYTNRSYYHVIQDFAKLAGTQGRMGVFTAKDDIDLKELDAAILKHQHNPN